MEIASKKQFAVDFIKLLRAMDPDLLTKLITREAGEDLAKFFLSYCKHLISKDSSRIVENTASAMMMGYLIRSYEERRGYYLSGTGAAMPTA